MTFREGLRDLSATRGVRSAAVVSLDGFVIESSEHGALGATAAAALAPGVAASRRLGRLFAHDDVTMTTLEFERGLALVVPLAGGEGVDTLLVVVLEGVDDVGRARMAVRRVVRSWRDSGDL